MIKRLKRKFVAITMALMTVMLCVILALVLYFTQASLEQNCYQRLQNMALSDFRPGRPGENAGTPIFTMMVTHRGEILVSGSSYYDLTDHDYLLELARDAMDARRSMGKLKDYDLRFFREETAAGTRISFADMSHERQIMQSLLLGCGLVGLASLVGLLGISWLLARWAVRPVERAWQQQRQFVADASHELKTPLTVITTNAELLLQPEGNMGDRDRFSANILTMARQMRRLVEGLLELARGDNAGLNMAMEPLDLTALVEESCLIFEPVAFESGLALETGLSPAVGVTGSSQHLRQVVEVLLDNAVKYAAAPGTIRVALSAQTGFCRLMVANPGPEIPGEELEKIFHRFYRGDRARTGNSFGLGLSIARSVVEAHGGKIWAESSGGINSFFVQLSLL